MRENEDAIAIYSRKSRFTGKGESIGNQVELAKEYIRVHFGDDAVKKTIIYEDEGFSRRKSQPSCLPKDAGGSATAKISGDCGLPAGPYQPQCQRLLRPD